MCLDFKRVQLSDIAQLQKIAIQTFTEAFAKDNTEENLKNYFDTAFSLAELQKQIQNPDSFFYFLRVEEEIIGYFKVNIGESQTELKTANSMELERIYIKKQYQGQGFGKIVLEKTVQLAKALQKKLIWLGVWEHNLKAIKFYQRFGFQKFDKHVYPVGDDPQIDWMMKLNLTSIIFNLP